MSSSDDNPQERETTLRPEYTGPEEIDRVLVHLREARERAARIGGKNKSRRSEATASEEMLSFEHMPPPQHTGPAEPSAAPQSTETTTASLNAGEPASTERAPPVSEPARASANPPSTPDDSEAMAHAMERLKAAADKIATVNKNPEPQPSSQPSAAATAPTTGPKLPDLTLHQGELRRAVRASRPAFRALGLFSFAINILMLAGPLFMLQVYDRVMTSHSMPTLVALFGLTAAIYGVIGLLELVRARVIVRIGVELDQRTSERVFAAALRRSLAHPGSSMHALRDLDQLRQFIAGPGPNIFFDAPWTPIYLLVIFLVHWTLGVAAAIGALVLLAIAWVSETRSRDPLREASKASQTSLELAEGGQRNAEAITAMGMLRAYRDRWQTVNRQALAWQVLAADRLSGLASLSKSLRLLMQSMMLAIGAALAVSGDISSGSIIASTIIFGRALIPVEQIVAQWRSFVRARDSFTKLETLLDTYPEPARRMSLPTPRGHLEARNLRITAPEGNAEILAGISFSVTPGQMLAIIGPSGSGKSSLVRALVGLWPSAGGEVVLDGARLSQWNADELGRHVGYLPQSVELFAGTVRENISRFEPNASDEDVIEAARAAHAHDMIMALPKGYETELGAFGAYLSAGQRQRIGLSRALYGNPVLVVLDEPNANLDRTGDEALAAAIDGMRALGRAIVLVSHRVQAIGKADLLLYLEQGQQRAFGPRDDVLRFLQSGGQPHGRDRGARSPAARSAKR